MPTEILFPRRNGSPGNANMHTVSDRAVPAFNHYILEDSDRLHYFQSGVIETVAPTNSHPRMYAGCNKKVVRLDNGTITDDNTFNDVVQGMVICDSGSGTKRLLVGFGSSTNPRVAYRDLTTDTTPWTVQTTATYAQFWLIVKAGADLYAVTDAGVAILGEYRISKCPAGNDPALAASWANGLEVGTPEWGIFGLAAIGDSVVVGKPDGLYYYNDQTKRFENVLPHLVEAPHAVNGKGMRSVVNGVLYPTHDGKLYFFDGVAVQEVTPDKTWGKLPRDVGTSRITAIADNGDTVAVVTECWQNTTQGLGLTVVTRIAGTYDDVTAEVTNGNLSNGANVGTFGAAADDAIFIGSDVPIEAVCFRTTRSVNAAVQSFTTPEYSNGTAGTVAPFNSSFTSFTGIVDGSILAESAISLVNTGFPPSASNAVVTWSDINAYDLMTLTTITFPNGIGALTKYWVRLKRTTATGMTAGTTIDEVEIVPGRAGLPVTAANDFTHRDRAGGITHVYLGKRERTVGFTWHDVYAVHTYGGVWGMGWHSGRPGQASGAQNMGQMLVLWGRYRRVAISESPTRDPVRSLAPQLATFGTTRPGPILNLTPGTWDGGDPLRKKQWTRLRIDSRFLQPADTVEVYAQYEDRDAITVYSGTGGPIEVNLSAQPPIRYGNLWMSVNDAAAGQVQGPYINEVRLQWEFVEEDLTQDPAESTPSLT